MKLDVKQMSDQEVKKTVEKFKSAPCIICGKPQTGYRKLYVGEKVAFMPVCDGCKFASVQTLYACMEFHS